MQKPDWWPMNPYSAWQGRAFWDIVSEAIWAAMVEAAEGEWTKIWPVEPGHYWFHGWCSEMLRRNHGPEMVLVEVSKAVNALAYVGNGRFIYKTDAVGFWKKAVLPEPPLIEVLREALSG